MIPDTPQISAIALIIIAALLFYSFVKNRRPARKKGAGAGKAAEHIGRLSALAVSLLNESALAYQREHGRSQGEELPEEAFFPLERKADPRFSELLEKLHAGLEEAYHYLPLALSRGYRTVELLFDQEQLSREEQIRFKNFLLMLRKEGRSFTSIL